MKKASLFSLLIAAMILVSIALIGRTHSGIYNDFVVEAYDEPAGARSPDGTSAAVVTMVFTNAGDPHQTASAAEELALLLEQETGFDIRVLVANCSGMAVDWMATSVADYGWLTAQTYPFANDQAGAEAIQVAVRFGQPNYRAQFLVRTDSGINTLADLAGKNFAFPNEGSTSAFLYPVMQIFQTQGVTYDVFFDQVVFAGGHLGVVDAVYYANHEGTPIHGGTMYEDARAASDIGDIFAATKVITYTDYIPNDVFAARSGVPAATTQQIVDGLHAIIKTPEWADIMSRLYAWEDMAPTDDSAYDPIRDFIQFYGLELDVCSKTNVLTSETGGAIAHTGDDGLTTNVQVPPGAVTGTVRLSFTPLDAPTHIPGGRVGIGHAFDLTGIISGTTQTVTSLTTTYTMTVPYLPDQLQGTPEQELAIYWWNGDSWSREPSSQVDVIGNKVTAAPDHFSLFAVLGSHGNYLPLMIDP